MGVGMCLMSDGDVVGGINVVCYDVCIDMCVGVGGSLEGIVMVCVIKVFGGYI